MAQERKEDPTHEQVDWMVEEGLGAGHTGRYIGEVKSTDTGVSRPPLKHNEKMWKAKGRTVTGWTSTGWLTKASAEAMWEMKPVRLFEKTTHGYRRLNPETGLQGFNMWRTPIFYGKKQARDVSKIWSKKASQLPSRL